MNGKAHIHFSDGKPMAEVDKAIYLGGEINQNAGRLSELNNRINKALVTCNKLKTFWSKTNCSTIWTRRPPNYYRNASTNTRNIWNHL